MRDCPRCFNQRVLTNAYGAEVSCPGCSRRPTLSVETRRRARHAAIRAVIKFRRDLGKRKVIA